MTITGEPRFNALKTLKAVGAGVTEQQMADALGIGLISQAEAEAGTATTIRFVTAERIAQAIAALESGAGAATTTTGFDGILSATENTVQKALDVLDDIFKSAVTVTGKITASGGDIEAISTDAGAMEGPAVTIYRNSISPAISDLLGVLEFAGEDSAGNKEIYAKFRAQAFGVTSGSESAAIQFHTVRTGTLAERFRIGAGVLTAGVTGGDKGVGTINATTLYEAGTSLAAKYLTRTADFESAEQTVTADTLLSVTHSLGAAPGEVKVILRCKTADLGYSVGEEIHLNAVGHNTADRNYVVSADATQVHIVQGQEFILLDKSTFNAAAITPASWKWVIRAWT